MKQKSSTFIHAIRSYHEQPIEQVFKDCFVLNINVNLRIGVFFLARSPAGQITDLILLNPSQIPIIIHHITSPHYKYNSFHSQIYCKVRVLSQLSFFTLHKIPFIKLHSSALVYVLICNCCF